MIFRQKGEFKELSKTLIYITIPFFVIHSAATKLYWYNDFWWFDMVMHFLGGVFVGTLTLYMLFRTGLNKRKSLDTLFKFAILGVFLIGSAWEVYEYVVQGFTGAMLANPMDSFSDIFFDIAGGIYAVYLFQKQHVTINEWNKKN